MTDPVFLGLRTSQGCGTFRIKTETVPSKGDELLNPVAPQHQPRASVLIGSGWDAGINIFRMPCDSTVQPGMRTWGSTWEI